MLPFLKRKDAPSSGLIIKNRTPDEPSESEDQDDPAAAHEACARDLLSAIERKDIKGIAEALKASHDIADSEPHEEGVHTYDAQNIKAGQEE